jgi:uncharacterized membrane protein HdeD (DUF308 family)
MLTSGGVSLLLAVLLWAGFPSTALWAVGVLFGVNLLSTGVTLVALGVTSRRSAEEADEAEDTPMGQPGREV